jgi:GNAT superfamily N-acetyltransferase
MTMTTTPTPANPLTISYALVTPNELPGLFELRAQAMQGLGITPHSGMAMDKSRILQSFLAGIKVEDARHIVLDDKRIGFVVVRETAQELWLSHLNLLPEYHNLRIGALVLQELFARADAAKLPLRVAAQRESPSNRFYIRHGFVKTGENTWDFVYERRPSVC